MDRPSESFAKAATKQRFQELIGFRQNLSQQSLASRKSANELVEQSLKSEDAPYKKPSENILFQSDDASFGATPVKHFRTRRVSDQARTLRSQADQIRKVLQETGSLEDQEYFQCGSAASDKAEENQKRESLQNDHDSEQTASRRPAKPRQPLLSVRRGELEERPRRGFTVKGDHESVESPRAIRRDIHPETQQRIIVQDLPTPPMRPRRRKEFATSPPATAANVYDKNTRRSSAENIELQSFGKNHALPAHVHQSALAEAETFVSPPVALRRKRRNHDQSRNEAQSSADQHSILKGQTISDDANQKNDDDREGSTAVWDSIFQLQEIPGSVNANMLLTNDDSSKKPRKIDISPAERSDSVNVTANASELGGTDALNMALIEGHESGLLESGSEHKDADLALPATVLAIRIHRTDKLASDSYLQSAVVRVTIVDSSTGEHMKKESRNNRVTYYYENDRKLLDYILPVLTQVCDIPVKTIAVPSWEELLLFLEDYKHFVVNKKVIIFFELLNFVPLGKTDNMSSLSTGFQSGDSCFQHIAWAFLKMGNATINNENETQKFRLQLYYPTKTIVSKTSKRSPLVFIWWESNIRYKYPSSLYVTIQQMVPPLKPGPALRSIFPNQPEQAKTSYEELKKLLTVSHVDKRSVEPVRHQSSSTPLIVSVSDVRKAALTHRSSNQAGLVPQGDYLSFDAGQQGTSVVKFSNHARSLACGSLNHPGIGCIYIYEIRTGDLRGKFEGCRGIIYDLEWSENDSLLLSACADGTARLWNMETFFPKCFKLLPHPGFVYCAKFHPKQQHLIVTGCFDGTIRIWSVNTAEELLQELTGHQGLINVLTFDHTGKYLYSGGSEGTVKLWTKGESQNGLWMLTESFDISANAAPAVTDLKLLKEEHNIVVLAQNGEMFFVNLKALLIMRHCKFSSPLRHRIRGAVTTSGQHLFVGSDNFSISMFDLETGKVINSFPSHLNSKSVMDCDCNELTQMVAFCTLGQGEKVVVVSMTENYGDSPSNMHDEESILTHIAPAANVDGSGMETIDKISDVIKKLDSITNDLKLRQRGRSKHWEESGSGNINTSTNSVLNFDSPPMTLKSSRLGGVMMRNLSQL